MEKVYGYVRVSTDSQAKKGYGADAQESAIKEYCKKNGLELVKIYEDLGISGTVVDREGLTELITNFNGITKVVVLNTSRLWRSDTVKALVKREFEKIKADVISIEQPSYSIYTKDPNDFLINGMMELLDQYERLSINLKLARGRKSKVKTGVKGSGEAPLGYRWKHDGVEKPVIVVDETASKLVKEIFSKYLELGSLGEVKKYLDANCYKTNRGKLFNTTSIRNILTNEFYLGKVTWNNLQVLGQHEALISKVTFGKVKALLSRNRKN